MNEGPGLPSEIPEIEEHRSLLYVLAEAQLGKVLRRKVDGEDLVQETVLRAYTNFADFRAADSSTAVKQWLITILGNVLKDHLKRFTADKRSIENEQSVDVKLGDSMAGIDRFFAADQTSPSMAASRNEELRRLSEGLRELPEDMREVVMQKHINNKQVKEIAEATGRSVASVAGLLRRGLAELRKTLG